MLKLIKHITFFFIGLNFIQSYGQIAKSQKITIAFDSVSKRVDIVQKTNIFNNTDSPLNKIYFYAWANAYKNKKTALAKRFIENYDLSFHFSREKNRGGVQIKQISINGRPIKNYRFLSDKIDILEILLKKDIPKNDSIEFVFKYSIKLPNLKYTGYGIDKNNNIFFKHFYFSPIQKKQNYSNMDLDDMPEHKTKFYIKLLGFPSQKKIISNLKRKDKNTFEAKDISNITVSISNNYFNKIRIKDLEIWIYNEDKKELSINQIAILHKLTDFLSQKLGKYPYHKIVISKDFFKHHKVYGLDLLPKFINPFEKDLVWEMNLLHQLSTKYVAQIQIDKRKHPWIPLGIAAFMEYKYIEQYYPDLKLIGNIADFKLVKYYYASKVKMNEKYPWLYLYMARMNKDQKMTTTLDSLSNLNRNVAMPYKSALGLVMLQDEIDKNIFKQKLKQFYTISTTKDVDAQSFYTHFNIEKKHKWFGTYVKTRTKYDYKLKLLHKDKDSLQLEIKQQRSAAIPIDIFGIKNDSIVWKKHLSALKNDTIVSTPNQVDIVGLNYFNNYPELQTRNNFVRTKSFLGLNKSLQVRLYQDFDNPMKQQIYLNPYFEYNYYDGVQIGAQIMNENFLHNNLFVSITPEYGTKSKTLTGALGISYHQYFEDLKPYALLYGFNTRYYHYDHDLTYTRLNPYFVIKRRNKNLRKRQGANILFQYMHINKENATKKTEADSYQVFNAGYSYFDVNIIHDLYFKTDFQAAEKFGKISAMFRYRFLSNKNRQWDFRFYAGYFIYNKTKSNYFSFALDRPTDYLFQYNYYGRSETSGIFHQQFVWAEGGFKTFFPDQYANSFIFSNNINIGVWKWLNLYGDWAIKKNYNEKTKFYYDSGVRINLVQDYFEVFFPIKSSLETEITAPNYYKKIRLVFTIKLDRLFKMMKRGWY